MEKYCYRMQITYDGTRYSGWQVQPNGVSIQEEIQKALAIITRQPLTITGSGRTDAGVHAIAQVAHFKTEEAIDVYKVCHSLNGILPYDIRIQELFEVPLNFHAQYSAISKTYHYNLHLAKILNPFNRLYSWHIREALNIELLKEAAKQFIGVHNFTSFANEAHAGSAARDPIRHLTRLDVLEIDQGIRLEFEADGFLYKMVRNLTGFLIEVATHKRPLADIAVTLAAKDRRAAGRAAPPHGLFLFQVNYPIEFSGMASKER